MGACTFQNLILIKGNSQEAFNLAVEEEEHYNGWMDGYSGDIQTVDGFSTSNNNPRYGTKAFDTWMEKQLGVLSKRDCVCVEITGAGLKKLKERRGKKGKKGYQAFFFFGLGAE